MEGASAVQAARLDTSHGQKLSVTDRLVHLGFKRAGGEEGFGGGFRWPRAGQRGAPCGGCPQAGGDAGWELTEGGPATAEGADRLG